MGPPYLTSPNNNKFIRKIGTGGRKATVAVLHWEGGDLSYRRGGSMERVFLLSVKEWSGGGSAASCVTGEGRFSI